jgi:hypothetical protein
MSFTGQLSGQKKQFVLNTANKAKNFCIRLRLRSSGVGNEILKAFVASAFLRSQDDAGEFGHTSTSCVFDSLLPTFPLRPSGAALLQMLTSLPR